MNRYALAALATLAIPTFAMAQATKTPSTAPTPPVDTTAMPSTAPSAGTATPTDSATPPADTMSSPSNSTDSAAPAGDDHSKHKGKREKPKG